MPQGPGSLHPRPARARLSALHRAAESAGSRSRRRPAPPLKGATALANKSGSGGRSAVEATEVFIARSPGCRQGTILAPVAAWRLLPGSKKGRIGLGIFGSTTQSQGLIEVTSAATQTKAWHEERLRQSRRVVADQANALQSRRRACASETDVASGRDPGHRPGAVTAVTRPAWT